MKKALLSPVLLLLLAGALTGCSRFYWSKAGASAEQFTQDNQACVQKTVTTLPRGGASVDAARDYYRACLNSRGYAARQAVRAAAARLLPRHREGRGVQRGGAGRGDPGAAAELRAAARPARRPEGARADHRGGVRHDAQAPGGWRDARRPHPAAPAAPPPPPGAAPASLAGRWNGSDRSVLDIRGTGSQLEWDWELVTDRTTARARHRHGSGSLALGRSTAGGRLARSSVARADRAARSTRLALPDLGGGRAPRNLYQHEQPAPQRPVQARGP